MWSLIMSCHFCLGKSRDDDKRSDRARNDPRYRLSKVCVSLPCTAFVISSHIAPIFSVSAASQAITFFIRAHLARCEEQGDFPVILRHHLSGTEKDDDLFPALYSRSGGNVSNKLACDENGVVKERLTCFRRNTIVWYLSKVAGAPCPFARAGIAIRDYAEGSAISAIEGRKGEDNNRGVKRKRDRDQRTSARLAKDESPDEEDESVEGKKPPKIKLTLRLRPCLTTMRDKQEEITSSSDSESESNVGPAKSPSVAPSSSGASPSDDQESAWSFPPFPIQRHISVPPFTPATESFPYIEQQSPIAELFTDWPRLKPKLELACTDTETSFPTYLRDRSSSVASPPPDSDDGFSVGEDDDESFTMSPEICFKDEDNYGWPQAALFTTSVDLSRVKVEPAEDVLPSKRSSLNTVTNVKSEDMELNFESLSLEVDDEFGIPSEFDADVAVKKEEGLPHISKNDTTWSQPIDLTMDEDPVARSLWRNVEILGPESVCRQELESNAWDLPDMRSYSASSQSPRSLVESAQSWSVSSPETDVESVGPLSPASFNEPEDEPIIQVNDSSPSIPSSLSIQRSEPWSVPGKELDSSIPSRIGASGTRSSTLAINESIVPWERGRYTIDDINDHLLQPVVPLILNDVADEESSHDLVPLSPQEEEIFQSLCFDPDVALTKPANSKAASSPFANIFAVATRPTERLRERRSSRLLSELERARPQSAQMQHQCDAQAQHVEGCNDNDRSAEEPMPMRITRSKDKAAAASNGAGKEPVRRSKRVASSVPQRKSQRLQGKNAH